MMKPIHTFIAVPSLPPALEKLRELVFNLRWAWNHETIELFRRLDSDLWEITGHNPVLMLGTIDQAKLEAAAADEGFLASMDRIYKQFKDYLEADSTWFSRVHGSAEKPMVAYFSAEFGLTECLSIFAGGLGILAGDHLKSASDLGVPLIGVGLLYQQGYFRQYLNEAGWQQEVYENNDFHNLPITLIQNPDGTPLIIEIPHPGRTVKAQIWLTRVGRVPLYLLDTNIHGNRPEDRDITDQLYGGGTETRLKQEIVLGIGGYRAVKALGLAPTVFHMNEGHSAFLALERIRRLMEEKKLSFEEAREAASAGLVFTTHTPVAAGHDYFTPDLIDRYLNEYQHALGLSREEFLALGRKNPKDKGERFCMTVLALRLAAFSNGVSRLHGEVSRRMWQDIWPAVPETETPITHVTNGVHFQSWISREMKELYDRYLGPRWRETLGDQSVWSRASFIAAEELWRTHERRRERLVAFCRRRLRSQLTRRGASRVAIDTADEVLDPEALTIGFARRFATYKRATLLLSDPDRLDRILNNPDHPVQIIFAGKAHPRDDPGKELIRQVVELARQDRFRRRVVFIENYDMAVARYLKQGADVWLNTPIRLREASGTSGMKAAANGVLNLSILDGWWDEAYQSDVGWAIGRKETYADQTYQDQVEAEALYGLLEREVVPMFYGRGPDGLPRNWIAKMKANIESLCYFFNTHRMVANYTDRYYLPAADLHQKLTEKNLDNAKALAEWKSRLYQKWSQVKVESVDASGLDHIEVGREFQVTAQIQLGDLTPADVQVELFIGRIHAAGEIEEAEVIPLQLETQTAQGTHHYLGKALTCPSSGLHGFSVRVLPHHPDLTTAFLPGLITWA